MNVRHLATKSFDSGVKTRQSTLLKGTQVTLADVYEQTIEFDKVQPQHIDIIPCLELGKNSIKSSPLGGIVLKGDDVPALSSLFDYKSDASFGAVPNGTDFKTILESSVVKNYMRDLAEEMFPNKNIDTGEKDINKNAFYTPYIPLVALTGCVPPQTSGGSAFFNPEGVVTVAEFLDGLNSIKYGANSNRSRKKTMDNISVETDYFNEGYQSCLRGLSSPFFNLYTRDELLKPITRIELAYITVICWENFIDKFNNLYGGSFYLGINFDWEMPVDVLKEYADGYSYKVSKVSFDEHYNIISLNVKDYKGDKSMTEYKESMKDGRNALPLPMFMSMLELGVLDLFHYDCSQLDPLREVSRGELAYFLMRLAGIFPIKYIKEKEV